MLQLSSLDVKFKFLGPVLGESSFAMAVSKLNDNPEKGWLYLCRAILGVIFFFYTNILTLFGSQTIASIGGLPVLFIY